MAGEVYLNLQNVIDKLLPEALSKGLEYAGQLIENEAKRKVPVDDGVLRASITHAVDNENSSVSIGTSTEYAPYVEFGTGLYNPEGRKTAWIYTTADGETYISHGQKAQPFLQPAIDENLDNIINKFENLLDKE
ncbi:MAG: HK97-gp10 family putative phage morphogenesis protein [Sedimentibacter sp.]|uniref:HK97-gp10 family putative phage morphogenesis protein n=1 Tax=Sedimentibacter sp. TaxID=1960295 RepID=UPI0031581456